MPRVSCPTCGELVAGMRYAAHKEQHDRERERQRSRKPRANGRWGSSHAHRTARRHACERSGYRCERCGISEDDLKARTNGRKSLQMHHVDGDWSNHADANLRMLCTRCHAEVERGRKQKAAA